jgi:hypothetical protein
MSTQLLTEVMEKVVLLNDEERNRLLNFLTEQKVEPQPNSDALDGIDIHRIREREWLKEHRSEYAGQYVALDGNNLVSHGTDGRKVYADARQAGVEIPYIVRIEAEDEPPFGGW